MAIKFKNYKNSQILVADTEPMIAALWGSSDKGINASKGQDYGWRLAPEVLLELKRIKKDLDRMEYIANRLKKPLEEVRDYDVLLYISAKTDSENAPVALDEDLAEERYEWEVAELERKQKREAEGKGEELAFEDEDETIPAKPEENQKAPNKK